MMTSCNSDGTDGVSWQELQSCMKKHKKEMAEHQIPQPSREEFNSVDNNSDGIVTDAEWKKFLKSQHNN